MNESNRNDRIASNRQGTWYSSIGSIARNRFAVFSHTTRKFDINIVLIPLSSPQNCESIIIYRIHSLPNNDIVGESCREG